ncbi:MAG: sigma-70 family RNA polymerase sigma factor [Bacillota bacterium]
MIYILTVYNSNGQDLAHIILRIKEGDNQLREKFIKDYIPFIVKVLTSSTQTKIDIKNSDEYSIGLIAFNEAIEKYDANKNKKAFNFFTFATQVIKRRVIDYLRFNSKNKMEIPFSYFEERDVSIEDKYLKDESWANFDRMEVFQEINHYSKMLKTFDIDINDLHKYTPKHTDSIKMCVDIGRKIAENKDIYNKIVEKKYFPMKDLLKLVSVHPSTIEKNRKFILSVSVIYPLC